MFSESTNTDRNLNCMFPRGVPVSVHMVNDRPEIPACGKDKIIEQISKEHNGLPSIHCPTVSSSVTAIAALSRKAAMEEAVTVVLREVSEVNRCCVFGNAARHRLADRITNILISRIPVAR